MNETPLEKRFGLKHLHLYDRGKPCACGKKAPETETAELIETLAKALERASAQIDRKYISDALTEYDNWKAAAGV